MENDPHIRLMLRFQKGDEGAFQELFEAYKAQLLNYIFRFCQDRRVAEELTQEVFIRVYRSASSYRPEAKFSTWIYRIATNMCLNEMRSSRYQYERTLKDHNTDNHNYQLEVLAGDSRPKTDEKMAEDERNQVVRDAIAALPEKQRLALILSVYEQCSYKEIGLRLKCSEGAVKSIIHRAKLSVKTILQRDNKNGL